MDNKMANPSYKELAILYKLLSLKKERKAV